MSFRIPLAYSHRLDCSQLLLLESSRKADAVERVDHWQVSLAQGFNPKLDDHLDFCLPTATGSSQPRHLVQEGEDGVGATDYLFVLVLPRIH